MGRTDQPQPHDYVVHAICTTCDRTRVSWTRWRLVACATALWWKLLYGDVVTISGGPPQPRRERLGS